MIAHPGYWEEIAKRMYADGENRALAVAVDMATRRSGQMIDSLDLMMTYGQWFTALWRDRYWLDDRGRYLVSADLQ